MKTIKHIKRTTVTKGHAGVSVIIILVLIFTLSACSGSSNISRPTASQTETSATPLPTAGVIPIYTYHIINSYPHDTSAFTQGLIYTDSFLYEGTGLRGSSSLRRVDLESGEVLQFRGLDPEYFGEGITIFDDRIIQLTWQSNIGFVYDRESFEPSAEFHYPTEGWGITHDGKRLIMSDGTNTIHFLHPETFEETGRIEVFYNGNPVERLNELEHIRGRIYANVWQTDLIAIIDPADGRVAGWIDLTGLLKPGDYSNPVDVLNGIAYDANSDRLFVTGKLWPLLFEIELIDTAMTN